MQTNDTHTSKNENLPNNSLKYHQNAAWPCMRGNLQNNGCYLPQSMAELSPRKESPFAPYHLATSNAIFSTPIIDENDYIYIGSGDHIFYKIDPFSRKIIWQQAQEEVIDCAACIDASGNIYSPGCDAKLHAYSPDGKELWTFNVLQNRKKNQLSMSPNYWFEGNIQIGPDGAIYVVNDDFFLYKLDSHGEQIWNFQTGFLIWACPSFNVALNHVYVAGFDHVFYAINSTTGKLCWKRNLHGSMVSSPAIGSDGTIFQGSFSGKMVALSPNKGNRIWELDTKSHIYASAAVSPNNIIYFGSSNGLFYAVDGSTGNVVWTYFIGEAIRSSAAIGADPEQKSAYLVYFGGGDGQIYALDPDGNTRWIYNTLHLRETVDYPNINASIALGKQGLATASSTGDIIWIPYDHYLRSDSPAIRKTHPYLVDHASLFQDMSNFQEKRLALWHRVSPGGITKTIPIKQEDPPGALIPSNNLTLRLLEHYPEYIKPVKIVPESIKLQFDPPISHDVHLQSDNQTLHVIFHNLLPVGDFSLTISLSYIDYTEKNHTISQKLDFNVSKDDTPDFFSTAETHPTMRIVKMAVPFPTIVPSLDQIGLASLNIPFAIVDTDPTTQKFIAWGVQNFGEVGVPQQRLSLYGFTGFVEGSYFQMVAKNCLFEITALNLPLNEFRLRGQILPTGEVATGASLVLNKSMGQHIIKTIKEMGSNSPLSTKTFRNHLKKYGIFQFLRALWKFIPATIRQIRDIWGTWRLLNHHEDMIGVGTYSIDPLREADLNLSSKIPPSAEIRPNEILFHCSRDRIRYQVKSPWLSKHPEFPLSILVIDTSKYEVVPINYSALLHKSIKNDVVTLELSLSKIQLDSQSQYKTFIFANLEKLNENLFPTSLLS